jgi:hypothetical protein
MTKHQAFALNILIGCLVTWGSIPALAALGVGDEIQGVIAMLGLVATSFMVGVIVVHYGRKEEVEEAKGLDRRR